MKALYFFWVKTLLLYWFGVKILGFNLSLRGKNPHKPHHLKKKKGVVIVEYVLLLVACVAIAVLISKAVEMANSPNQSGWLIKAWMGVLKTIAEDM